MNGTFPEYHKKRKSVLFDCFAAVHHVKSEIKMSKFKRKEHIKEQLSAGNLVIPGYDIAYPVNHVSDGSYASVFRDANGHIIRISEEAEDHYVDVALGMIATTPTTYHTFLVNDVTITVRDDIPSVTDKAFYVKSSVENINMSDAWSELYPGIPVLKDMSWSPHIYDSQISDIINEMFRENIDSRTAYKTLSGFIDIMKNYRDDSDFREKVSCLYNYVYSECETKNNRYVFDAHNGFVLNNNSVDYWRSRRTTYVSTSLIYFLGLSELLIQHPAHHPVYTKFFEMMTTFIKETGCVPYDCHEHNLGIKDGTFIFRDPYYLSVKHSDYQIRVGQHRKRMGLPIPDEWNIHLTKLDVLSVLMCDDIVSRDKNCFGSQNMFADGKTITVVGPEEMADVVDALRERIPFIGESYRYEASYEQTSKALKILNITETRPEDIDTGVLVQTVPTYVESLSNICLSIGLNTIYEFSNILHKASPALVTALFDDFSLSGIRNTKERFEHISHDDAVVLSRATNVLGVLDQEKNKILNPLVQVIGEVYSVTGFGLHDFDNLCYDNGVMKMRFYSVPKNYDGDALQLIVNHVQSKDSISENRVGLMR